MPVLFHAKILTQILVVPHIVTYLPSEVSFLGQGPHVTQFSGPFSTVLISLDSPETMSHLPISNAILKFSVACTSIPQHCAKGLLISRPLWLRLSLQICLKMATKPSQNLHYCSRGLDHCSQGDKGPNGFQARESLEH